MTLILARMTLILARMTLILARMTVILARMTLILRGRKWGFSLEEIRQWLLIYEDEGNEAQMRSMIELADRQLADLAEQQKQLKEAVSELQELRDKVAADLSKG